MANTNDLIIPTIDRRTVSASQISASQRPAIHEVHPTFLEQFMACPYKAHDNSATEVSDTGRNAFYEWDITEQLLTAYQYWEKLGDEVLRNFWNSTEFPTFSRLQKHAQNRKDYLAQSPKDIQERFPLFTQKRMSVRILMDSDQNANSLNVTSYHEFYLTWTADRVYSDYTIADCKTAKSKRWKNEPDFRLQWRLYPRMRRVTSNLPQLKKSDTFNFTYYVFTKQVTPQLQVINLNYTYEDAERLVFHLLSEYVKAYDNDEREPKKCLWCKWCPLRTQCPRYGEDWLSSFATADEKPWAYNNSSSSEEWEWRF